VDIYRQLAQSNPEVFLSDLAWSLGAYANVLLSLERHSEASRACAEGLEYLMPFYRANPQAFADLAEALRQDYLQACHKAGEKPSDNLLATLS